MRIKNVVSVLLIALLLVGIIFGWWSLVCAVLGFAVGSFYTFTMLRREAVGK